MHTRTTDVNNQQTGLSMTSAIAKEIPPSRLDTVGCRPEIVMGDVAAVVFVIDNDPSMCAVLEDLVGSVQLEVRLFASPQEFLASKRPDVPGCLVLDVRLPGMSGLTFQNELARMGVDLPVIFITRHGDIRMSVRAMKAGAVDFLTKPFRDQDVLDAIQAAIERDIERRREGALVAELRERYATLTERERQTMSLVVIGHANKLIAADLDLSEMTVKVHRGQAMRKMRARSLPELVRIADRLAGACSNVVGDLYQSYSPSRPASPESVPAGDEHARANGFARSRGTHLALANL
jgi:FixJ family two-component response regulator